MYVCTQLCTCIYVHRYIHMYACTYVSKCLHFKNELVILTLIWLQEFQCSIDNKYYACEV